MPDRPDDSFDDELREGLDGLAGEATPPPKAPPKVLASARRRIARNAGAAALALGVVVGGSFAVLALGANGRSAPQPIGSGESPSSTGPVAPTSEPLTTAPSTSNPQPTSGPTQTTAPVPAPSIGQWSGPNGTMVFVDGVVYQFALGSEQPVIVGFVPDDTAVQPPVWTPSGVVVLGAPAGRGSRLWLIPADGGPAELLASHVNGFAVSADGSRIADSELDVDPRITTLWEGPLSAIRNVRTGDSINSDVRVVGFAGTDVIVDTGDGASASAAVWSPGQTSLNRLDGYGTVVATDPASGFAVLTKGDGRCWVIASLGPTGNAGAGPPKRGPGCGIAQASFQPGGDAIGAILLTSEDRSGPQRFVLAGTTSQLGGETNVDGAFQTWWKGTEAGAPTILVLSEPQPDRLVLMQCVVSEQLCSGEPVWTASGAGDPGTAWIVEERPAPK